MLTQKTRLYAQHRLAGLNQTAAAIAAGYSASTATPAASRLEKNKSYIDHMARLRAKLPEIGDPAPIANVKPAPKVRPEPISNQPPKPVALKSVTTPTPAKETLPPMNAERKLMPEHFKNDMNMGNLPAPLAHMLAVMNDPAEDPRLRMDAAKALASFTVAKPGELGKKEQQAKTAENAATGKFAASAPPRLVARH